MLKNLTILAIITIPLISSCAKNQEIINNVIRKKYSPIGNWSYKGADESDGERRYASLILRSDYSVSLKERVECDESYTKCYDFVNGEGKWSLIDSNFIMLELTKEGYGQKVDEDFRKENPFTAHLLPPTEQIYFNYICYYDVKENELILSEKSKDSCENFLREY